MNHDVARSVWWAVMAVLLPAAGCTQQIETEYGHSRGLGAAASVNGTAVLSRMFEQAGHKVYVWRTLSPRLHKRADCIVWFTRSCASPSEEVREWLEEWLIEEPGRSLILVLRDYDAEAAYWEKIQPLAPAEQQAEVAARLKDAKQEQAFWRITPPLDAEWFQVQKAETSGRATSLSGEQSWLEGINPARTEIEVRNRLVPGYEAAKLSPDRLSQAERPGGIGLPTVSGTGSKNVPPDLSGQVERPGGTELPTVSGTGSKTLLACEHGALVTRESWEGSQAIVVANGSFLLNLPLVNHEHRKLAARLIAQIGPAPQRVAFLESYWGEPPIRDKDPSNAPPTGLEILSVWPTNWILLHLIAAGLVFCFSRWPIFGLPRDPDPEPLSDLGKHVAAVAEHLKKTGQRDFAHAAHLRYKQTSTDP